ncbi:T-cell surface glycoprotein CD8 alpha chain [Gracilinanus agilis]|uniref:T-cell surface glycoprotein CD8 alpha chain n=1 Tax=Gracilinanus agilis TaxID=191870 RepID=UPI001CFDE49D|nr:T-cell surface glycoprotein CD8 alpha chain [Gracilinanus agilis]
MGWPSAVCSLLLPLALLLEPLGAQEPKTFRMDPRTLRDVQRGQELKLHCETMSTSPTGCSWLRLTPGAVVPTFLLYLSGSIQSAKVSPDLDSDRFGGSRSLSTYTLTLKDFQEDDQGYYYCVVLRNSRLSFSPFVPVFMPVKATTAPAPKPKPTTPAATNSSIQSAAGSDKCKSSNTSEKKGLDFSCDLYIWMPLTGGCVVLFLALITTIIICQRSRRRVCQCPRPLIRPGGKAGPSGRCV